MRSYFRVLRHYARALLVLFIIAPLLSAISYDSTSAVSVNNEPPVYISGTHYNLVTKLPKHESTASYNIFIVTPQTPFVALNSSLQTYIDHVSALFKNEVGIAVRPPKGFLNQLTITPRIDYISDSAASVTLQTEEYRTNKDVSVKYQSWLYQNGSVSQIVVTAENSSEISKVLGLSKEELASYIGATLPVGFLPNYQLRLYKNVTAQVKSQYIDVQLNYTPHIAKQVQDGLYNLYPKVITNKDRLSINKLYQQRQARNSNSEPDCSVEQCVALTFDDGPDSALTPRILDILKTANAKATFFVLGNHVQQYPEVVKRTAAEGHEVENHTFAHPDLIKLRNPKLIRQQIDLTQGALGAVGVTAKFMRPPYGSMNASIGSVVNMPIILWNVDSQEWRTSANAAAVTQSILLRVRNGAIVLMHDTRTVTVDALPDITKDLIDRGYRFVTVAKLLSIDGHARGMYVSAP